MRISLLFIPLFSLLLTLNASESPTPSFKDPGSAVDIKKDLAAKLADLAQQKKHDLMQEITDLPMTQEHFRKQQTLTALEITGAGVSLSLAAETYAPIIGNGLRTFCPAQPIDRISDTFIDKPWLFSAVAAVASIGSGLLYKWYQSSKPVALDSGAKNIIVGFAAAQKSRLKLGEAVYAFEYDKEIITEGIQKLLRERLEQSSQELTQLSQKIVPADSGSSVDPDKAAKVAELLRASDQQRARLDDALQKQQEKKNKKKKGPQYQLNRIAKTFTNAIGLNALRAHGQTRSRLVEQVTPDILNFAAGVSSTLGMMACEQVKTQNQSQYHAELKKYLITSEDKACQQEAKDMVGHGIERLTKDQQFSKELAEKALDLQKPIKEALETLQKKRESNELSPDDLIAENEHLIEVVKTMLDAHILNESTQPDDFDEEDLTE